MFILMPEGQCIWDWSLTWSQKPLSGVGFDVRRGVCVCVCVCVYVCCVRGGLRVVLKASEWIQYSGSSTVDRGVGCM